MEATVQVSINVFDAVEKLTNAERRRLCVEMFENMDAMDQIKTLLKLNDKLADGVELEVLITKINNYERIQKSN